MSQVVPLRSEVISTNNLEFDDGNPFLPTILRVSDCSRTINPCMTESPVLGGLKAADL